MAAQHIDRYWQTIKEVVEQGHLSDEVKVSTAINPFVQADKWYVICVSTYDYQDEADVMRILQTLKELDMRLPIGFHAGEDDAIRVVVP